jgi:hypothetical protein
MERHDSNEENEPPKWNRLSSGNLPFRIGLGFQDYPDPRLCEKECVTIGGSFYLS